MPPSNRNNHNNQKKQQLNTINRVKEISSYRPERYALAEGYYSIPSQQQIFASNGRCNSLVIGNKQAIAFWPESVDISTLALPLTQTISLNSCQIEVYLRDRFKPIQGKQLNKQCRVTFKTQQVQNYSILTNICNTNKTKLIRYEPHLNSFTVEIPHFTKYRFDNIIKPAQKAVERRQTVDISADRKRRVPEEGNNRFDNRKIFGSIRLEEEAASFKEEITEDSTARVGDLLDCVRDYVSKAQGKLYEKQQKFPTFRTYDNEAAMEIQNRNRQRYGYKPYQPEIHNLPALQNFMFSADGKVVEYKSYQTHKKITFISQKQPTNTENLPSFVENMLADEMSPRYIAQTVCNIHTLPYIRTQMSLYAVLFEKRLQFYFDSSRQYAPRQTELYEVDEKKRFSMVKDWLTWTVRVAYGKKQVKSHGFNSKVMNALVLRKPQLALDNLMINNQWQSAMVLPNIEDQSFRQAYTKTKSITQLVPQLQSIMKESLKDFNCKDWLLNLALSAWYFNEQHFIANIIKTVDSISFMKKQQNILLLRMFQLWAISKNPKLQIQLVEERKPSLQMLCSQWAITNQYCLGQFQQIAWKNINKNGQFIFRHYCYEVTRRLVEPVYNYSLKSAQKMIKNTKMLSEKQYQVLMKMTLTNNKSMVLEQISEEIKRGHLLNVLRICLTLQDPTQKISQIIYELAVNPEVLGTYKRTQIQQLKFLLAHRSQQFSDLLTIITFSGPDSTLSDLQKLINIHDGYTRFSRTLGVKAKHLIVAKIEQCLRYWLDRKKDQIQLLKNKSTVQKRVRELLDGSDLLQNL